MDQKNIDILKAGGVGIVPTDTIYGLVGSALSFPAVERISQIKNRTDGKGFIILISSIEDLNIFGIKPSDQAKIFMKKFWPGKVSIEFVSPLAQFDYLKKTGGTIAFRFPDKADLLILLKKTWPLVAPSANIEGLPPAKNIEEARKYFGDKVDFYEDEGDLVSEPSTLVKIDGDKIEVLRQGAVRVEEV